MFTVPLLFIDVPLKVIPLITCSKFKVPLNCCLNLKILLPLNETLPVKVWLFWSGDSFSTRVPSIVVILGKNSSCSPDALILKLADADVPGTELRINEIGSANGIFGLSLISTLNPEPAWML